MKWIAAALYGIVYTAAAILSRIVNRVVFGGDIHQSLSARAYIEGIEDPVWAQRAEIIDRLIFWEADHCEVSWLDEVYRARETLARDAAERGDYLAARVHLAANEEAPAPRCHIPKSNGVEGEIW